MRNLPTSAKGCAVYNKDVDFDTKCVRPGKPGARGPEFKCFNCGKWFSNWKYTLGQEWYPKSNLKFKINFLCGPTCSDEITPRYKKYFKYELPEGA